MPRRPLNEIDRHIGRRIRERRIALCISQGQLGEALNISFQQIQKYEAGRNKIAASLLREIARQLQVPITYFFEEGTDGSP